jgi:hypothetical protein
MGIGKGSFSIGKEISIKNKEKVDGKLKKAGTKKGLVVQFVAESQSRIVNSRVYLLT